MAVLITTEAIVRMIRPQKNSFNVDDLNGLVDGWIEPVKIGPLWVMYKENAKDEPINEIASLLFQMPLHGKVLVVPVQQLPREWDLMEPEDQQYSGEEVDCGFLLSLQNILVHNKLFKEEGTLYSNDGTMVFDAMPSVKEEWIYDPHVNDLDENTKTFFKQIYEYVISEDKSVKEGILYEDEGMVVRVQNVKDIEETITQMIDVFVEDEEYEKCAQLQKMLTHLKDC
jgi:hypothetical protein